MNMTKEREQTLWWMINDQIEDQINKQDAEYVCEQWWAEIEWPDETI